MKIRQDKDASLTAFVLEQLDAIEDLRSRKMFGAHGLHAGTLFFALIHEGKVFFKTSEAARDGYQQAGMAPFSVDGKVILKNYWQVPVEVLEDSEALLEWAKTAIALAGEAPPRRKKAVRKKTASTAKSPLSK